MFVKEKEEGGVEDEEEEERNCDCGMMVYGKGVCRTC